MHKAIEANKPENKKKKSNPDLHHVVHDNLLVAFHENGHEGPIMVL